MDEQRRLNLERTVRLYPAYVFLTNTYFWLPVFILFFLQHLPLKQVLLLEAIYYAGVVILEVPSGYFSDRIGRRPTLMISSLALCVAYSFFLTSSSFLPFAFGQLALATGLSFKSGTDTSLHFDALASLERDDEFGDREARVSKLSFYASAVGALMGGAIGLYDPRMAYLLSFGAALGAFCIVLMMAEPHVLQKTLVHASGFFAQLRGVVEHLKHPVLRYVFAFYVFMTILNHIPYEFYQPYIDQLVVAAELNSNMTPLWTGIHTAVAMLVASWFAGVSIQLKDRLGLKAVFVLAAGLQTIIIGAMAAFTSWFIAFLILARSTPRALMTAPINAAVAPLLHQDERATYFSFQSLIGRLAFSLTLVAFSVSSTFLPGDTMTVSLKLGTTLATIGLLILIIKPYQKN
jgi:MFS family permease